MTDLRLTAIAAVAGIVLSGSAVGDILVGPGSPETVRLVPLNPVDRLFEFGTTGSPVVLTADTDAGPLSLQLVGNDGGDFQADNNRTDGLLPSEFGVRQHLKVGPGPAWTSYSIITDPGWLPGDIEPYRADLLIRRPGETEFGPIGAGNVSIRLVDLNRWDLTFYEVHEGVPSGARLLPGTELQLTFALVFRGATFSAYETFSGRTNIDFIVLPEPTTAAMLLGCGAVTLGVRRHRGG